SLVDARARAACGSAEPFVLAARRAICAARNRFARLHRLHRHAVDRAHLGGAADVARVLRALVGPRDRARHRRTLVDSPVRCAGAGRDGAEGGHRMTLLRGYIMFSVFRGVATVLAVLVAVFGAIELVGQMNDLGSGDYGLGQALSYVLLRLPRKIVDTLPA